MAVNTLLDMTSKSLAVYQKALAVTSNNIANANNEDYTRQRVVLSAATPQGFGNLQIGMGVKLETIQRMKNQTLDNQIIKSQSSLSFSEKQSKIISQVESLFSEPSDLGISNLLNTFYNSFEKLSASPTSVPLRTNVVQSAQNLATKAQSIYEGLDEMKLDLAKESENTVTEINNYLTQISTLNKQVYESSIMGNSSNDLLDKRDRALEDLSKLVNISVVNDEYNVANVSIGGVYAVGRLSKIELESVHDNGKLQLKTLDGTTTLSISGGELYSTYKSFNQDIKSYQSQLDSVLGNLYNEVNALHSTGYSLTDPPETGINFFSDYENGHLEINKEILSDVNLIAASSDGTTGDNEIAKAIANIQSKKMSNGLTISDSYSNLVSGIGYEKVLQDQNSESFDLVISQLKEQKSNYSGVSLDEELTDVLKFQKSYNATAKIISIADEMLQTLINMV